MPNRIDYSSLGRFGGSGYQRPQNMYGNMINQAGYQPPQNNSPMGYMSPLGELMDNTVAPNVNAGKTEFTGWDKALGGTLANGEQTGGYVSPIVGALSGLGQGYLGMQQLKLGKNQLNQDRKAFNLNYDAQRQTTNAEMRDRQAARVQANPDMYQSVDAYMNQNQIRSR